MNLVRCHSLLYLSKGKIEALSRFMSLTAPTHSESVFVCCCLVAKSCPTLATPWTLAHQAPLSMGFPRQEYWSGLPFPSPGDLLDPDIKPRSLMSPALAGRFFTTESPGKPVGLVLTYWKLYSCFPLLFERKLEFFPTPTPHNLIISISLPDVVLNL